jgi:ElaB/YqjD/DUF883 family membrane-anchored ribosome-binding protein
MAGPGKGCHVGVARTLIQITAGRGPQEHGCGPEQEADMPKTSIQKLNKTIQDLVAEVADNLRDATDKTGEEAQEALQNASAALSRAAHHLAEQAHETGAGLAQRTREEVQEHPWATAALIASAAALIGLVAARRLGIPPAAGE